MANPVEIEFDGHRVSAQYPMPTASELAAIAAGAVTGKTPIYVTGRNGDVDNVREDIWEIGGTYVFPPDGGIQMRVVSTSAADDGSPAGTGARTVDIHYLDAAGATQSETVTLNGTSAVNTVATDILRIQDFHVKTVGSGGAVAGVLSLQNTAGTVTYSSIDTGNNKARQAIFTIPAGCRGYITTVWAGAGVASGQHYLDASLRSTSDFTADELTPGVFQHKVNLVVQDGSAPIVLPVPICFPALADIKISAVSDSGTANVVAVAGFNGWYEVI